MSAPLKAIAVPTPPTGIAIKLAFLHQAITWPGVCGSEKTLSGDKIKGIKMSLTPQGLLLELKNKKAIVPHTNVVNYVLEDGAEA